MSAKLNDPRLFFPHPAPPPADDPLEVAPGVLWVRLALPFRLDHVNVYLIEDGEGWAVLDTGIDNAPTRAAWEALLSGPLAGRAITRLVCTHHHPDHVGLAGWFHERFGMPLLMSETEYLVSLNLRLDPGALEAEPYRQYYEAHGLDRATTDQVLTQGHRYLRMVSGLPGTFRRLIAGETLRIGSRRFEVLSGGGHSPEQILLFSADEKLFLSADQVLARISPNISVSARDPYGDPLGIYLRSLRALEATVLEDVLVLPGHNLPFFGLHARIDELSAHHAERCAEIRAACRSAPLTAAEIVPVVFHRALDPHQMSFAFSEVLAHVNFMLRRDELRSVPGADGIERVRAEG